jgi:hypothetical protein
MPDVEPISITFLSGLVMVLREMSTVLASRIDRNGVQQSASEAAFSGDEWSIPLFRADAPTIHLKNRRTFTLFTIYFFLLVG